MCKLPVNVTLIAIALISFLNLSACTEIKEFFASSASSASLGSVSVSSVSSGSSASVSGSMDSVSNSSGKAFNDEYVKDISDLTYAYVKFAPVQSEYESFQNAISEIAIRHGVIHWESNSKTYIAFGKGLKKANLTGVRYETVKQLLAEFDYAKMLDIQKGYESE
ncbi:MAG: putative lipoprotein [Methyloprofundus sp.]|nr:putative lipoprotein [Methyloprofundus sp.]